MPAIWENPRPLLDLQIAKKLFENKENKIEYPGFAKPAAYFYHDIDANDKFGKSTDVAIKRNYGTNISLTLGYTINNHPNK